MDMVTDCYKTQHFYNKIVDKTLLIWFTTQRRQHQLPVVAICPGGHEVLPVSATRNLDVYFDSAWFMPATTL
jgi:hypothetical protein